jgi:glycolate oxidase FAD binding subunit
VADCSGIVEYEPGDLTLTAHAGTSLEEIGRATGEHGQWLALDPYGGDDGTIGATIATASSGPHAATFGAPRDLLLGVEFVTGQGDVVRGGGRVVKNVAGFDLTRLTAGAWGTLGVITEVTVRLRALAARSETVAITVDDDATALDAIGARLRGLSSRPNACELVSAEFAAMLGLARATTLIVRIGGNEESMRAQRRELAAVGSAAEVTGGVWHALRTADSADCAVWRVSERPSCFGSTWAAASASVGAWPGAWTHGNPLRGVVRCVVPGAMTEPTPDPLIMKALAVPFGGTRVGETLPAHVWSAMPAATSDRLSRGIRRAFDPEGILNPGIFGVSQ